MVTWTQYRKLFRGERFMFNINNNISSILLNTYSIVLFKKMIVVGDHCDIEGLR